MAYKIFLSHSTADKKWVSWIAESAEAIGIDVYMYEHDIQPGTTIADKVQTAIGDSQALVVLLTPNSQYSPYVQQEIGFARAKEKPVIPLVQTGVANSSLAMLDGREYIIFNTANPQEALSHLLEYLSKLKKVRERDQAILVGLGALFFVGILASKG